MKTVVILIDGMRPDAFIQIPYSQELLSRASYALDASAVMPSSTLPCIMSLFHSVDPSRHGTTTNIFTPQVSPIDGLCEVLNKNKKICGMFHTWGQLRDVARPGSIKYIYCCDDIPMGYDAMDARIVDTALKHHAERDIDFSFIYFQHPDAAGHKYGWMSEEYMIAVENSLKHTLRILDTLGDDYEIIILADHGGHDRGHGRDCPEDMTIPILCIGKSFTPGKVFKNANIKDIAPTITALMGVAPAEDWEGKSLLD